jgi:hypothetical protein
MQDDRRSEPPEDPAAGDAPAHSTGEHADSRMRARTWVVAANYRDPADYDVPELPSWYVSRPEDGGVALATDPASEPFVAAENPVRVRR